MCLVNITTKRAKVAKKDIVVYKHLDDTFGNLRTAYMNTAVEIGETYRSALKRNVDNEVRAGLHSFKNFSAARSAANMFNEALVECVIPAGSKYYVGVFGDDVSYASDTLRYVKIMDY